MAESRAATEGLTRVLARFAAGIRYEHLPPEAVSVLKRLFLDTIACSLAGTTLGDGCAEVERVVRSAGGSTESTVIGFGLKAPALTAAFANGATAHALNYDGLGDDSAHLGLATVPAPLAAAERRDGVAGKEFIAAMCAAAEVTARLASASTDPNTNPKGKYLVGQLLGYFGAAVGAGRAMALSIEQMHSVLGLALMQAAGTTQVQLKGDPTAKAVYGAFPNLGGMLAALLGQQGLCAQIDAIDGQAGLYGSFYDEMYSPEVLARDLGEEFLLLRAFFKPWPVSGVVHPFIEAACILRERHQLKRSDISRVVVRGNDHIRGWVEPMEERRRPPNGVSACNSVFFGTAKGLANGKVDLSDFTQEGLRERTAIQIAEQTDYLIDDTIDGGGVVEVTTQDGHTLSETVRIPLGHPERPLSYDQIVAKLRDCAQYAAAPVSEEALDRLIEEVDRLESVEDVSTLAQLVMGRASS